MKLILTQEDLLQAVRLYTAGLFTLNPDANMTIDFKAGRGENGMSAEVDINYLGVTRIAGIADAKPVAAATAPAATPETPAKKVDGRTAEGRAQRKAGLFEKAPTPAAPEAPAPTPVVADPADEGTTPVDVADTTIDTEAAQREAEAEEILAEAEREAAGPEVEEVEAAPPPAPTQRKSLFADVAK